MNTTILVKCPHCSAFTEVVAPTEAFRRWRNGEYIQDVLPELSDDDREALISGLCPDCWDEVFGEDDE